MYADLQMAAEASLVDGNDNPKTDAAFIAARGRRLKDPAE
jgi:hypothetical protein